MAIDPNDATQREADIVNLRIIRDNAALALDRRANLTGTVVKVAGVNIALTNNQLNVIGTAYGNLLDQIASAYALLPHP